jgi:hypothetical protein
MEITVQRGLTALLVLSCTMSACSVETVDAERAAVIDGTADTHPFVGWLKQGPHNCTATVVSNFHVLTAAHCLADELGGPVRQEMISFTLDGAEYPAHWSDVTLHPDFANNVGLDLDAPDAVIQGDYAVVGFELQLSPDYAPLASRAPLPYEQVAVWGFGRYDASDPWLYGESYRTTIEVQEIYDDFIMLYGDDPTYGMLAPGDSGGPAFNFEGEVLAVHSQLMPEDFLFSYDGREPRTEPDGAALDMRVDAVLPWLEPLIADGRTPEGDGKMDGVSGGDAEGAGGAGCAVASAAPSLSGLLPLLSVLLLARRRSRPSSGARG